MTHRFSTLLLTTIAGSIVTAGFATPALAQRQEVVTQLPDPVADTVDDAAVDAMDAARSMDPASAGAPYATEVAEEQILIEEVDPGDSLGSEAKHTDGAGPGHALHHHAEMPVSAQGYADHPGLAGGNPVRAAYDGAWDGEWVTRDRYEGVWQGSYDANAQPYAPGLAYTASQRADWIEQCQANYVRSSRRGNDGRITGGVLGALAGGVIGNRVADGNRLAGTVIGAGLGGLAGAEIGDALADSDRRLLEDAYFECETYLRNYEAQAASFVRPGYGPPGYAGAPVYWVKVPIHRVRRASCNCEPQQVVEEVIEEDVLVEHVVERRTIARPAPRPVTTKSTKLRSTK